MKTCSKCSTSKYMHEFNNLAASKDGKSPWCRECSNAADAKYREANRETLNRKNREYREKNSEEIRERRKAQRKRDPRASRKARNMYQVRKAIALDQGISDLADELAQDPEIKALMMALEK